LLPALAPVLAAGSLPVMHFSSTGGEAAPDAAELGCLHRLLDLLADIEGELLLLR
jgi:hypothetical protein